MTFAIHGLAVSRGIAIGRAVLVASSRVDVAHYFIEAADVVAEIARVRAGRDAVVDEKPITFIARAAAPTLPAWLVCSSTKRVGSGPGLGSAAGSGAVVIDG